MDGRWIRHLVAWILSLLASAAALGAETELPFDSRPLIEVHTLDAIPKEVITLLGWHKGGPDGIAVDRREFNATDAPDSNLPRRFFVTAAVCSASVIVFYELGGRPPTYHAIAFVMTRSGWSKVREWSLEEFIFLRDFLYTVDAARYPGAAQRYLTQKRRQRVMRRIWDTQPARRDQPLRKLNLSDDEAREIQYVMAEVFPGVLLNISGVVEGCPCEEGAYCSDQVWVVPRSDARLNGVLLSRISGHWTVGPIQKWWLRKAELEADNQLAWSKVMDSLWEQFPTCVQATAAAK